MKEIQTVRAMLLIVFLLQKVMIISVFIGLKIPLTVKFITINYKNHTLTVLILC